MKILINLIGGQTIPNLIAHKYVQPQKTILLYSSGSVKPKENYKAVLNSLEFEEYEIQAYDFSSVQKQVKTIIKDNLGSDLVLNFTGGTKIMSLASFEVFKETNKLAIYIDSENNKIYHYRKSNCEVKDLEIKLTAVEILKLNGHKFKIDDNNLIDNSKKEFFMYLESNFDLNTARFFSKINEIYSADKESFYKENYKFNDKKYNLFYNWNNASQTSELELKGHKFKIKKNSSIKYISGLWFEDLVFYRKFDNLKYFDDILRNVHILDKDGKRDMIECDIMALHNNNFYLFELKSGKPRRESINNLRTIKEQLGSYTKLFLISYFDLLKNDTLLDRMKDLGITFFNYREFDISKCFNKSNINL